MTHPDKILLLLEECENLQSASAHLRFSMERTRDLMLDQIAKQAAVYCEALIKRVQAP